MGDKSKIEWTDATWNVTYGCTKVSAGCKHCYAERVLPRLGKSLDRFVLAPDRLDLPLQWKRPRRVFVNSLSDLFHEDVPDRFIAAVFGVMAAAKQHTFQVLTKRPERARRWFAANFDVCQAAVTYLRGQGFETGCGSAFDPDEWPLPNAWLGVSVEDQRAANERIPHLLATPAAVRFISGEPLLGSIDLGDALIRSCCRREDLAPKEGCDGPGCMGTRVDWVIVGGESGARGRPMDEDWVRSIRDQCVAARVPFFYKQRISGGRKVSTPVLDGRTWAEYPDASRGQR